MEQPVGKIAVVQGASGAAVQEMFRDLVERLRPQARIAGVIEESHGLPGRKCRAGYLRSIASGALYSIFHDLGPGAEACQLEGGGAASAASAVEADIAAGCDLVVLSKFRKLEAERRGLAAAFAAAIGADVPVLTFVPADFEEAWSKFAGPSFVVLPAEAEKVEAWWRAVRGGAPVH